jgi:hypothetical protein
MINKNYLTPRTIPPTADDKKYVVESIRNF